MAYSESPITVERMAEYLSPLLEASAVAWNVEGGTARRFAYKLREGLFAAAANAELFPELAQLYQRVRVNVVSKSRVEVREATKLGVVRDEEIEGWTPPESGRAEVETRTGITVEDVIARWQLGAETKLYFPKADFTTAELKYLHHWTSASGVIFFENAGALTLMAYDAETAEYAWSPEEVEE